MAKKLLIITRSRLSENNGGANASKGFITCLAALFPDCSVICPAFEGDAGNYIPSHCKVYPYKDNRSKMQKGFDVYRGRICANAPFVKQHLLTHQYEVVVIDNSFSGASLVKLIKQTGARLITIHHNVERDYQHDNRKEYAISFRLPYIYFAEKAERECLLCSDVNLTLTMHDATVFSSWHRQKNLHLHQWGTFEYKPIADRHFEPRPVGHTFVITGSLYFMQSLLPILQFVDRYWPLVRSICPTANLIIAGRNPSNQLIEACSKKGGISIVANPKDMGDVVRKADYYICPIDAGSGLKLRVMDGLRQGLPVLCHKVSAAGYEPLAKAGCLFPYTDEPSFRASLQRMLDNSPSPTAVYHAYKNTFSTETGIERLRNILEEEQIF